MAEWRWPPWSPDAYNLAARVEVPEAGGWVYKYRDGYDSTYSHVFVPNLQMWADRIAASIARPKNTPVSVSLDLEAVSHVKQPVPNRKRS